jgi:trans-aconitate methyltransferase
MNELKCSWLEKEFDPYTYNHRKLFIDIIEKYEPFESVLDIGCAHGADLYLLELTSPGKKLQGIDRFDLERARVNLPKGEFKTGNIEEFIKDYPDKSVDMVISNGVWMYLPRDIFLEFKRIAKKAVILSERVSEVQAEYLKGQNPVNVTKVTKDVRETWKEDGYIYEFNV